MIGGRKVNTMISGGNATIYVADIEAAIRFYTEALGLTLTNRIGRQWATLEVRPSYWTTDEVGGGLIIGLLPASPNHPAPGTIGAVGFGFETYQPIENVMASLIERKVRFTGEVIRFEAGNSVTFEDPDGNSTYLHEFPPEMVPQTDAATDEDSNEGTTGGPLSGGHAIVYVSDMDAAIGFYSGALGLKLTNRFGDKFATVEAGQLVVALHPQTARSPIPGTRGAISLGFVISEPIEAALASLAKRGVRVASGVIRSELGSIAEIEDQDGNSIYLREGDAELLVPAGLALKGFAAK